MEIINKPLLLHLVGYLYYWQMGFNSVFKGLKQTTLACLSYYIKTHHNHTPTDLHDNHPFAFDANQNLLTPQNH